MLNLLIIVPILALNEDELHMANDYYVPITISRFSRLIFFCIIMIKFYELGETDVDRQMKVIIMTLVLIIIVNTGIFAEIENSSSIDTNFAKGVNENGEL